jgi:hypothetical protein
MAEHQKAGAAYRRASALEFDRVEHYANEAKRVGRGYIVQAQIPRAILGLPVRPESIHVRAVSQVWRWLGAGTPRLSFAILAVVAVALLLMMAWIRRPLRLASECERCGMAACRRCNPEMPDLRHCGQCHHAFVLNVAIDQQLRIKKEIEAHRHALATGRLRRLVSLLLAGGGQLITGATLRGLLYLTAFCSSLVALLGALDILPAVAALPDASVPGAAVATVAAVLAALAYLVALWDGARDA